MRLAHGSDTRVIRGFSDVPELYHCIAQAFGLDDKDILYITMNSHKIDMAKLLSRNVSPADCMYAHVQGGTQLTEVVKSTAGFGLTITDNSFGRAIIKRIRPNSIMAACATIAVGDGITEVNGVSMEAKGHNDVARVFRAIGRGERVTIRCYKPLTWTPPSLDAQLDKLLNKTNSDHCEDWRYFRKRFMRLMRWPHAAATATDIDAPGPQGSTMLNTAAACGHSTAVKQLVGWGADPNGTSLEYEDSLAATDIRPSDKLRVTPLLTAAGHGHAAVASALLRAGSGVNVCAEGSGGRSALAVAAARGHHEVVRLLLASGADVAQTVEDGRTAAYLAACADNPKVVEALASHGADLDAKAHDGSTPVAAAVSAGVRGFAMLRTLVGHGAGIDVPTGDECRLGCTPLALAAQLGDLAVVEHVVELGASVNAVVKGDGRTPLYMASQGGHARIVSFLHDRGATMVGMSDGASPLYAACWNGHTSVVDVLLGTGCDVNSRSGKSPLAAVARWRHIGEDAGKVFVGIMATLLDHGADVSCPELAMFKHYPVARAVEWNDVGLAKRLLFMCTTPNMTEDAPDPLDPHNADEPLSSPIMEAALRGSLDTVRCLAAFGAFFDEPVWEAAEDAGFADVHEWLKFVAGWSAIEIAIACRMPRVVEWLLRTSIAETDISKQRLLELATSHSPCPSATPPCARTTKLAKLVVLPWSPERCRHYHSGVRNAAQCLMLIEHGLWRAKTAGHPSARHTGVAPAGAGGSLPGAGAQPAGLARLRASAGAGAEARASAGSGEEGVSVRLRLPGLPRELWIYIASFLRRDDWVPLAKDARDMLGQRASSPPHTPPPPPAAQTHARTHARTPAPSCLDSSTKLADPVC